MHTFFSLVRIDLWPGLWMRISDPDPDGSAFIHMVLRKQIRIQALKLSSHLDKSAVTVTVSKVNLFHDFFLLRRRTIIFFVSVK
jgi:hypothetical protein